MIRILQVLLSGLFLGMGISTAFAEFWLASAGCFVAGTASLFLFIRTSLQEATIQWHSTSRTTCLRMTPGVANAKSKPRTVLTEDSLAHVWPASTGWKHNMLRAGLRQRNRKDLISRRQ
jgi:hypothetical protein